MTQAKSATFEYADGVQVCFYRSTELIEGRKRVCHKIIVGNASGHQLDWEAMPRRSPNPTIAAWFYRYFVKYLKEQNADTSKDQRNP